jgi:hypothetical protein
LAKAKAYAQARQGPESWNYVYIFLGFALSIEGTIIQMLPPEFPLNLVLYLVFGAPTWWLFMHSGRFQSRLRVWKESHENKFR